MSSPAKTERTGRILRFLGTAVALGFIGVIVARGAGDLPLLDLGSARVWWALAGALLVYVLSQYIGAIAWRSTLRIYDVTLLPGKAEGQVLVSQIGKYIPGNVAHFIGRFALARADGVSPEVVGAAMVLEIGMLLTSASLMVAVLLLIAPGDVAAMTAGLSWQADPALSVGLGLVLALAAGGVQVLVWRHLGRPRLVPSRCLLPVLLHIVNFVCLGLSLWLVTLAVAPDGTADVLRCVAIFTVAWVAGFLMPGAPGGIGVRDGIIALGLGALVGPGPALGVAIMHRGIAVLGDVGAFGLGTWLRR